MTIAILDAALDGLKTIAGDARYLDTRREQLDRALRDLPVTTDDVRPAFDALVRCALLGQVQAASDDDPDGLAAPLVDLVAQAFVFGYLLRQSEDA